MNDVPFTRPPGSLLSREEMEQLTGYKQMAAQLRWLKQQFDIEPPRRADGLPILTHMMLESLLHKRSGLPPPAVPQVTDLPPGVNFTQKPKWKVARPGPSGY